jgi:hypothetical protein
MKSTSELRQALDDLRMRLRGLADEFRSAADGIAEGIFPPAEVLGTVSELATAIETLSRECQDACRAEGVDPSTEGATSLDALSAAIDTIERARAGSEIERATDQLYRILAIRHRDLEGFGALGPIAERVAEILEALESAPPVPDAARALLAGEHPLAHLLELVEHGDQLEDAVWLRHAEAVRGSLGEGLGIAAQRGHLVVESLTAAEAPSLEDQDEKADEVEPIPGTADVASSGTAIPSEETATGDVKQEDVSDEQDLGGVGESAIVGGVVESAEAEATGHDGEAAVADAVATAVGRVPDSPAAQAARELLRADASSESSLWADVVWGLVDEGDYVLAHHLSRAVSDADWCSGDAPNPSLLGALVLGPAVCEARSAVASSLEDALLELPYPATEGSEVDRPVSLLTVAAFLRASLIAPHSGAGSFLSAAVQGLGIKPLAELCQSVVAFSERHPEQSLEALLDVAGEADARPSERKPGSDLAAWCNQARAATTRYQKATELWRHWLSPDGAIDAFFMPIQAEDREACASLVEDIDRLRRRGLDSFIDREFAGFVKDKRKKLVGGGRKDLIRLLSDALDRCLSEAKTVIRRRGDGGKPQAGRTRDFVSRALDLCQSTLAELMSSAEVPWPARSGIAARCCSKAVQAFAKVIGEPHRVSARERAPGALLNADLLRLPGARLDAAWQLERTDYSAREMAREILEVATDAPVDWIEVFHLRQSQENHEATASILRLLTDERYPAERISELRTEREEALRSSRRQLVSELLGVRDSVEEHFALGLLPQDAFDRLSAQVSTLLSDAQEALRIPKLRGGIEDIEAEVSLERDQRLGQVRQELEELSLDPQDDDLARIETAIEAGDVYAARTLIETIAAGESLPRWSVEADVLVEFFPGFVDAALAYMEGAAAADVLKDLKEKKSLLGVSAPALEDASRETGVRLAEAWFTLQRTRRAEPEPIRTVFQRLGFSNVRAIIDPGTKPTQLEPRQAFEVRTDPVDDRSLAVVPMYGSDAQGSYRVVAVWDAPPVDDLLRFVGDTGGSFRSFVFFFGSMSADYRRELADACRRAPSSFLALDDILVLYLALHSGSSLPVALACALPFTVYSPYASTGGVAPEMFYGRQSHRNDIVSRQGACLVYGARQLGKTALLRSVERDFHRPEAGFIVQFLNLNSVVTRPEGLTALWRNLVSALKETGVVPRSLKANVRGETLADSIAAWLAEDASRRVLLLPAGRSRRLPPVGRPRPLPTHHGPSEPHGAHRPPLQGGLLRAAQCSEDDPCREPSTRRSRFSARHRAAHRQR